MVKRIMGHCPKWLLCLLALLPAVWLAPWLDAAPARDDGPVYLLDFRKAGDSDENRAKSLVERFRRAAAWAVPDEDPKQGQGPAAFDCKVEFVKPGKGAVFTAYTLKRTDVRVSIAESPKDFLSDVSSQNSLMTVMLLARCGLEAEHMDRGFPEWIADGLARKVSTDAWISSRLPGSGGLPAAYSMGSRGLFPGLKPILGPSLDPSYGECFKVYAEYCNILLLTCARNGMVKEGLLAKMIRDIVAEPEKSRYESFVSVAGPFMASRRISEDGGGDAAKASKPPEDKANLDPAGASLRSEGGSQRQQGRAKTPKPWGHKELDEWFSAEISRSLLNGYTPASGHYIETLFKEASRVAYKDEKGVDRVCEMDELPGKWKSLKNPDLIVSEMRLRITLLGNCSPPCLQEPLKGLLAALGSLLAERENAASESLAAAKREFYKGIEWSVAQEAVLKRAEAKAFPPGARYGGTMAALKACDVAEEAPYSKEAAFLDAFLKGPH